MAQNTSISLEFRELPFPGGRVGRYRSSSEVVRAGPTPAGGPRDAVKAYLLFFVETADSVDVVRILHQRRDPTRHL